MIFFSWIKILKTDMFSVLSPEIVEIIVRKSFVSNLCVHELFTVSKTFATIMDKYTSKCKMENFTCKGCYYKAYEPDYDDHNKFPSIRCNRCHYIWDDDHSFCDFGNVKVRGLSGFCRRCLLKMRKRECISCKFEFVAIRRGKNAYCLKCLPLFRPYIEIEPERKEVLPTDEPFCY